MSSESPEEGTTHAEPILMGPAVHVIMRRMTDLIFADLRNTDTSGSCQAVERSFRVAVGLTRSAVLGHSDWRDARKAVREAYAKLGDREDRVWVEALFLANDHDLGERAIEAEEKRVVRKFPFLVKPHAQVC